MNDETKKAIGSMAAVCIILALFAFGIVFAITAVNKQHIRPTVRHYDEWIVKGLVDSSFDRGVIAGAIAQQQLDGKTNLTIELDKLLPKARDVQGPTPLPEN